VANIQSSEKKNRQRITREARNRSRKSAMRTAVKKFRAELAAKIKAALPLIDRAAVKGVIKKGTAARTVSRLQSALNGLA
jgi:small subunit ribosomal protein S20